MRKSVQHESKRECIALFEVFARRKEKEKKIILLQITVSQV